MQGAPVSENEGGWFKSSFSTTGACVEVKLGSSILVRDSKDPEGPVLRFSPQEWTAFLQGVLSGEFHDPDRELSVHGR